MVEITDIQFVGGEEPTPMKQRLKRWLITRYTKINPVICGNCFAVVERHYRYSDSRCLHCHNDSEETEP